MSAELTTQDDNKLVDVLINSLYPGAARESAMMAIAYCRQAGLDIMQKPVHIVPMWDGKQGKMRDVVMPGISLYRVNAARSGFYGGMSDAEFGDDITATIGGIEITYPKWCRVSVSRITESGQIVTFPAKEFWLENYAVKGGKEKSIAPNSMWAKRPYAQLAKCAEAQALRKAFPESCPANTAEEMEGKDFGGQPSIIQPDLTRDIFPEYPDADFNRNLPTYVKSIEDGKQSADSIIVKIKTKWAVSTSQQDKLRAIKIKTHEEKPLEGEVV